MDLWMVLVMVGVVVMGYIAWKKGWFGGEK